MNERIFACLLKGKTLAHSNKTDHSIKSLYHGKRYTWEGLLSDNRFYFLHHRILAIRKQVIELKSLELTLLSMI